MGDWQDDYADYMNDWEPDVIRDTFDPDIEYRQFPDGLWYSKLGPSFGQHRDPEWGGGWATRRIAERSMCLVFNVE
jgi:hypothetical protein